MTGALRLVLGDQLSDGLSALADLDADRDVVVMAEVRDEATYVRHHKQKIALTFAAMRKFAGRLEGRGVRVRYVRVDDAGNAGSIAGELTRAVGALDPERVIMTECGEWRLAEALKAWAGDARVAVEVRQDGRFICSHDRFRRWAADRKQLRMEFFYREMRRETGLLMDGDEPVGGRWNFDAENRKKLPKGITPPGRKRFPPDAVTREAMDDVARLFPDHFGTLDAFDWPTTAEEAEAALAHFLRDCLPGFGDWQDAMKDGAPWMWHALTSTSINLGLLDPLDVCRRAEAEFTAGRAPLNAVEGFIRQILGWREFVRGIYWLKVPEYRQRNFLDADRTLPWFYWSGETDMACVADVVARTRDHAYAHHIERLMVTGNLAMLLGVHPDAVDDWYMVVFADAYEWVEIPNTRGMATFADGGIVGSKPYAASGAYVDRMSDWCGGCRYDVKAKSGEGACPFNRLYWGFLERNRPRLRDNIRLAMPYRTLDGWSEARRREVVDEAEACRGELGAVPRT
ncbi:MAG: cryptochrome/photolyase family protein [Alphaproteobacteria bacterium]|nr:cryptochrome/photolyase family protein [Alphaproteobacteria bacterium]MBU1525696.1 cryptochrome/photolyase family protein [Alphaproteobacteria bacterium]MBU2117674.1 cryptochrome/photolyase family protein [Alphaproteobacteria bacterium]MBU2351923.1 cryptochrome/photolyase family protein [Alphaproteobacteria bacterium]MBU2382777.1 cryptochrome/photolyase family protein [Alphaproteobacteria bacterium]